MIPASPVEALPPKGCTTSGCGNGLVISAFLAIPVVNLLTPLFAAGMMVHLHKLLSKKDPLFADQLRR